MKNTKPYRHEEEDTGKTVSEPIVGYQGMASLQLEADKARLIRAIVNIDNKSVLDKVKHLLCDVLNIREDVVADPEPDSKEYIISGLREAFLELKEVRAGKGRTRPAEELLKELTEEREEEDD